MCCGWMAMAHNDAMKTHNDAKPMPHAISRLLARVHDTQAAYRAALDAARDEYPQLFAAVAKDLGLATWELGARVGFDPITAAGNAITRGEVPAADGDVVRLAGVWMAAKDAGEKE